MEYIIVMRGTFDKSDVILMAGIEIGEFQGLESKHSLSILVDADEWLMLLMLLMLLMPTPRK